LAQAFGKFCRLSFLAMRDAGIGGITSSMRCNEVSTVTPPASGLVRGVGTIGGEVGGTKDELELL
jgi:hypothetical protein